MEWLQFSDVGAMPFSVAVLRRPACGPALFPPSWRGPGQRELQLPEADSDAWCPRVVGSRLPHLSLGQGVGAPAMLRVHRVVLVRARRSLARGLSFHSKNPPALSWWGLICSRSSLKVSIK